MPDLDCVDVLYLSPHFDDVAFSCAGSLCHDIAHGLRAQVVTVFAGPPVSDLPLRPLHRSLLRHADVTHAALHALWQQRRSEDLAAMAVLGSGWLHLEYADAVFRPEIERWSDIWEGETPPDSLLPGQLAARLLDLWQHSGRPRLVAPLAVGAHIDHRLVFAAVQQLESHGAQAAYYEELPYTLRSDLLDQRLRTLGRDWESRSVEVTPYMPQRITAACCYRSQITGSFRSAERAALLLSQLASMRSGSPNRFCERFWRRPPSASHASAKSEGR